jgi:hypothetical protein
VTGSSASTLTVLQRELLAALAARSPSFFLTGGAVLAGWVLGHGRTDDLDLFTEDDEAMADADRVVRGAAAEIGAVAEAVRSRLVRERVPALYPKVVRDGIRMDTVEEIVANKLCALVRRVEVRDLVDIWHLDRAGYRVERFLADAARKDGGVTPATVAYVLASFPLPPDLPAGADRAELLAFMRDLEQRMRRLALPGT